MTKTTEFELGLPARVFEPKFNSVLKKIISLILSDPYADMTILSLGFVELQSSVVKITRKKNRYPVIVFV